MQSFYKKVLNFLLLVTVSVFAKSQTASFTVNSINQCFATNSYVFTNTSTAGAVSYHWDFGDGTTSTLASPNHVYTSVGYHYVNLQATYSNGVTYTATGVSTYAGATPVPSFSSSQVTGLTYGFSNTSSISTGYVASYDWDFGDGSTGSGNYVTHTFASAGTYNVKLVVANEIGCADSITTAVVVSNSGSGGGGGGSTTLTPSFAVNNASQCVTGNSFVFTNTSSNAPLGTLYSWNFGDGNSSSAASPTYSYASAGYYSVSMTATYGGATYSTGSQSIYVGAVPLANYSSSFVSSLTYGFNSTSTVSTGYIASYSWDFGDGGTATTNYAQHTFASAGTYNVSLTVTTETGCTHTYTSAVTVSTTSGGGSGSGSTLTPSFTVNTTSQCVTGNSFVFTNTSSNAPLGTVYSWNFGDGNTSSATSPTHTYASAGYYYVSMTATYGSVTYSSGGQTIYCGAVPVANYNSNFVSSLTYGFNSTSTVSTGYIASYSWDFGDGGSATTNYTQHTFASAGAYNVSLTVTTETGCTHTYTSAITVSTTSGGGSGSTLTPSFTVNNTSQCLTGNSFSFTNTTASAPLGTVYSWSFGDGNTSSTTSPTHSYTSAGYYYVVLAATYGGQTYYSGGQSVYVGALPTAAFTSSFVNPLVYGFSSSSTVNTGYINSYSWDFGDGGTATSNYAQHTYASMGTYNVKLVVTTETGCVDSITTAVLIDTTNGSGSGGGSGVSFNPSFTVGSSINQCISGNSYVFTNTTASAPVGTTYSWNFGDGSTSSVTSPTHSYASAGYYYVTLTATYNGQIFTASGQTVVVVALPTASIATYHNGGLSYTFNNTSTTGMGDYFTSYSWSFGDGSIDSIPNPQHTYASAGVYTVSLTVTTSVGCTSTTSISVTTCPIVSALFSLSSANDQCQTGNAYTFTNNSTNNAGVPTSGMNYVWYFGDGTSYNGVTPPAHTYSSWGDYDVKLVATLTVGTCTVSDSMLIIKAVSVAPMPVASYRLILDNVPYMPTALISDTTKRCWHYGYDFSYQSSSTLAKGTMDYFWHFGTSALYFRDGDSSHYINPRIVFDTAGTYPVKLVVVSDKGCMDSVTRIVELSDPHARFNYAIDSTTDIYASPTVSVSEFSYDYGGYLVAWDWNFGGGVANSSSQNPSSFSYACGGNHSIILQVTSDVGCVDDTVVNFVIRIRPKAGFSISAPNYTPNIYAKPTYTFTNSTTVNDACPSMSYLWNFGDGYTSTSINPTHIFKGSGTYTVTLIATNNNGGKKDTTTGTVTVLIRPRAAFSTSQTLTPNVYATPTVSYNNTSSSQDTAAPAASLTYAWDFGDGSTSNVRFPSTHQYASGGTYTVTLIVTNPISGLSDTVSHNVTVNVKPHADFSYVFDFGGVPYSIPAVNFTNATTANDASAAYTYSWGFGDASTSTAINPSHTYTSVGTYTVTLISTNTNGGLKDTVSYNVTVCPVLNTAFGIGSTSNCLSGNFVNVNNASANTGSYTMSYAWNYGDGFTSTSQNPAAHSYGDTGTYNIILTTTLSYPGCSVVSSSDTQTVSIYPMPVSGFTISGSADTMCFDVSNSYNFTNTSSISAGTMTYAWNFGDAATATTTNSVHSYAASGTYTVKLVSTSNHGCSDSTTRTIKLHAIPTATSLTVSSVTGEPDYPLNRNSAPSYIHSFRTANDTTQCFNGYNWFSHHLTGSATSMGDYLVYLFDDGSRDSVGVAAITHGEPYHKYTTDGVHPVSAYLRSSNGCISNIITVNTTSNPNTDTLPHSVIGLHNTITNNGAYDTYKLNYASLSTTACRPIINSEWEIVMTGGNTTYNHGTLVSSNNYYNSPATGDSANVSFDVDPLDLPTIEIRLITTNDLGMKDTAYASFGAVNSGYSGYRMGSGVNTNLNTNVLSTYPNPAKDEVKVTVKLAKNTNTKVFVYDALGRVVKQANQLIFGGNIPQNINLSVGNLIAGMYYIVIKDSNGNSVGNAKFVKQ